MPDAGFRELPQEMADGPVQLIVKTWFYGLF